MDTRPLLLAPDNLDQHQHRPQFTHLGVSVITFGVLFGLKTGEGPGVSPRAFTILIVRICSQPSHPERVEGGDPAFPQTHGCVYRAKSGGDLLSQGLSIQVPSALRGLTSVFGKGTGVALSLAPPKLLR
jgi:hypothetical protein